MGRPAWIPTPEIMEQVESYASAGLTKQQIADCLGISYETLNEKTKEYTEFSESIKRGQAKGIAMVANELVKNVKIGNVTAQIFFLKCRAGWKEIEEEIPLDNLRKEIEIVKEIAARCLKNI